MMMAVLCFMFFLFFLYCDDCNVFVIHDDVFHVHFMHNFSSITHLQHLFT